MTSKKNKLKTKIKLTSTREGTNLLELKPGLFLGGLARSEQNTTVGHAAMPMK
jgi:hypothetical protein